MQIPILSGIVANNKGDFLASYPVNRDPVILDTGVAAGYLRPAMGIEQIGTGPGADRDGINWNGVAYRVMGTKLVTISSAGAVTVLGDVDAGGTCNLDYSFDNLIINSGDLLYYYNPTDGLRRVTDENLGIVKDVIYVDGYTMTTDGTFLVVTELNDPMAVDPLKYGSSEDDPDPVTGLLKMHGEVYALNRYTIQPFQNVGGSGFPFQVVKSGTIPYGCVGSKAKAKYLGSFAFVGGQRNAAIGVYIAGAGDATKISTRDVDADLAVLTEEQQAAIWMEVRNERDEQRLMIHTPLRTWVFSAKASTKASVEAWTIYSTSVTCAGPYKGRGLVYCYGRFMVADDAGRIGYLTENDTMHYGAPVGWMFDVKLIYNESARGIINSLELVGTPGRGTEGRIFFSYTKDGVTWSMERSVSTGRTGQRQKRVAWRPGVRFEQYIGLRFRGSDSSLMGIARLEGRIEALAA